MRKIFKKLRPRITNYWSLKHFSKKDFGESVIDRLSNQIYFNEDNGFNRSCKISIYTLNSFAPIKKKFFGANTFYNERIRNRNNEKFKAEEQLFKKE